MVGCGTFRCGLIGPHDFGHHQQSSAKERVKAQCPTDVGRSLSPE